MQYLIYGTSVMEFVISHIADITKSASIELTIQHWCLRIRTIHSMRHCDRYDKLRLTISHVHHQSVYKSNRHPYMLSTCTVLLTPWNDLRK